MEFFFIFIFCLFSFGLGYRIGIRSGQVSGYLDGHYKGFKRGAAFQREYSRKIPEEKIDG